MVTPSNLHPVRDLARLYPQHFRLRQLVSGAAVVESRPGTLGYVKDEWDYASDTDELTALRYELTIRRAEYARLKATSRDLLAADQLGLAIVETRDALITHSRITDLERAVRRLTDRVGRG